MAQPGHPSRIKVKAGRSELFKVLLFCFLIPAAALIFYLCRGQTLSYFLLSAWSRDSVTSLDGRITILGIDHETQKALAQFYHEKDESSPMLSYRYTTEAIRLLSTLHPAVMAVDYPLPLSRGAGPPLLHSIPSGAIFSLNVITSGKPRSPSWSCKLNEGEASFAMNRAVVGLSGFHLDASGRAVAVPLYSLLRPELPPPFALKVFQRITPQATNLPLSRYADRGYLLTIRYWMPFSLFGHDGNPSHVFRIVKLEDFLEGRTPPDYFKNKVVLLGNIEEEAHNLSTPVGNNLPAVVVDAFAVKMFLDGSFIHRIPRGILWLLVLATGVLTGWIGLRFSRNPLLLIVAGALFLAATYQAGEFLFVRRNFFADFSGIYLSVLPNLALVSIYKYFADEQERKKIRNAFSQYVGQEVFNEFLASRNLLAPQGSRKQVTILFLDIRNFTALSEAREPEAVLALLREFFGSVASQVMEFGGYINKFLGDGFMAVFGVSEQVSHASQAVKSSQAMLTSLKLQNQLWEEENKQRLEIGIGINSGEVIWGNVGLPGKMEFTVTGDTVNTASRLQEMTKQHPDYPVLLSESTMELLKGAEKDLPIEFVGQVEVRGKSGNLNLFGMRRP